LELNKIIQNLTKNDLKNLGLKMKNIADRRYKWEIIAKNTNNFLQKCNLQEKNNSKQSIYSDKKRHFRGVALIALKIYQYVLRKKIIV